MNAVQYAEFLGLNRLQVAQPQTSPAARSIIPILAALVPLLSLAAMVAPDIGAILAGPVYTLAHSSAEILYAAGAIAIFSVTWYAPRGDFQLRPTLVACIGFPAALVGMFHLLLEPGMPVVLPASDSAVSAFGAMTRACLPLILVALTFAPRNAPLSCSLRWSLLFAAIAAVVPLAWLGMADPLALFETIEKHQPLLHAAIVALFAPTILHVARRQDAGHRDAYHIGLAALLGALAEACLSAAPPDTPGLASLTGHLFDVLAMAAAFAAAYGQAIDIPYRSMERSHIAALLDKERLETIFRAITDGIIVVDSRQEVVAMNPVARHMAGCREQIAIGLPLAQALAALNADTRAQLIADIESVLCERRQQLPGEERIWPQDGGLMAVQYSVSPVRDAVGEVRGAVVGLRDVSERWRMVQELRESADYARRLIEASVDPMIVVGEDGSITDANAAAEAITGLPRSALLHGDFSDRFTEPERARAALRDVFPSGIVRDLDLCVASVHGQQVAVNCNITPFFDAAKNVRGAFVVARDITDLRQTQLQLEFQASCDALTTLPNRRVFRERMERAMVTSRRNRRLAAVMLLDLDDFKEINDTRGHAVGDELLKLLGTRLRECLRETDTVARLGGDEFGILVEDFAEVTDIHPLVAKIVDAVMQPVRLDGAEVVTGCSIGVSIHPLDPGDADTLMRNADTALYRAKEAGKGCCRYYTADMNAAVRRRSELASGLRNALALGELSLHYQPQLDLNSSRIVGVEALLRWTSETLGPVGPDEFIPVAEETGLIMPIGTWALQEACRQAAFWRDAYNIDIGVAVNLSSRQFRDADLVATVDRALAEAGLSPHLLELEITESVLMRDAPRAADIMAQLKQRGIRIAIDDFGTGYSSLAYLKTFPLDYLKIDRSFVLDIPGDASAEAIVRSVVALAHSLGLKVIAEGVETAEQMMFLHDLGCDELQGYRISRPRPAALLLDLLQREARHPQLRPEAAPGPGILARWLSMPA